MRARRAARGFTLLEAIVALIVLAAVASACLQLRSQTLRQRVAVARALDAGQTADMLLHMARRGMLDEPTGPDEGDERQRVVWRGEHRGKPYEITREIVEIDNPALAANGLFVEAREALPELVRLVHYTAAYDGGRAQEYALP